jgi:nucleoside-diphosphate-sugar epimerase
MAGRFIFAPGAAPTGFSVVICFSLLVGLPDSLVRKDQREVCPLSRGVMSPLGQEKLVLTWGKQIGTPTVALHYSRAYGSRHSILNPYNGVIAIFYTRFVHASRRATGAADNQVVMRMGS